MSQSGSMEEIVVGQEEGGDVDPVKVVKEEREDKDDEDYEVEVGFGGIAFEEASVKKEVDEQVPESIEVTGVGASHNNDVEYPRKSNLVVTGKRKRKLRIIIECESEDEDDAKNTSGPKKKNKVVEAPRVKCDLCKRKMKSSYLIHHNRKFHKEQYEYEMEKRREERIKERKARLLNPESTTNEAILAEMEKRRRNCLQRQSITEQEWESILERKRFQKLEKVIQMSEEERERKKMENFLRYQSWKAKFTKEEWQEMRRLEHQRRKQNLTEEKRKVILERNRERIKRLSGDKLERHKNIFRRGTKKYLDKMRREEPDKYFEKVTVYSRKRYGEVAAKMLNYQRDRIRNETVEQREKRLLRYRIGQAKRKVRREMEKDGKSKEEIEAKLKQVEEQVKSQPRPEGGGTSQYKPRLGARKPHNVKNRKTSLPLHFVENEVEGEVLEQHEVQNYGDEHQNVEEISTSGLGNIIAIAPVPQPCTVIPIDITHILNEDHNGAETIITDSNHFEMTCAKVPVIQYVKQIEIEFEGECGEIIPISSDAHHLPIFYNFYEDGTVTSFTEQQQDIRLVAVPEPEFELAVSELSELSIPQIVTIVQQSPPEQQIAPPPVLAQQSLPEPQIVPVIAQQSSPEPQISPVLAQQSPPEPQIAPPPVLAQQSLLESSAAALEELQVFNSSVIKEAKPESVVPVSTASQSLAPPSTPQDSPTSLKPISISNRPEMCDECGKTFKTKGNLMEHKSLIHFMDPSKLSCPKCSRPCPNTRVLWNHFVTYHVADISNFPQQLIPKDKGNEVPIDSSPSHVAPVSSATAAAESNPSSPKKKVNTNRGNKFPNICDQCGKTFRQKCTLDDHFRRTHQGKGHICSVCGRDQQSPAKLWRHQIDRHKMKDIPPPEGLQLETCKYCNEVIMRGYEQHVQKRHPENLAEFQEWYDDVKKEKLKKQLNNPQKCPHCKSIYPNKRQLRRHVRHMHFESAGGRIGVPREMHKCPDCGKDFKRKNHLTRHLREIHGVEKIELKLEAKNMIKISNRFKSIAICLLCGGGAGTGKDEIQMPGRNSIRAHFVSEHYQVFQEIQFDKMAVYSCEVCEEKFQKEILLREHLESSHSETSYKCKYCGIFKLSQQQLLVHEKNVHLKAKKESSKKDGGGSKISKTGRLKKVEIEKGKLCNKFGKELVVRLVRLEDDKIKFKTK